MDKKNNELLRYENEQDELIILPTDNLVANHIKGLREELEDILLDEDFKRCVLDMEKVEIVDSKGVSFIIGLYKSLDKESKLFELKGVRREITDLFSMMKLDEILKIK